MSTTIYRGITHTEEIEVKLPDGSADDLTGHVFKSEIRSKEGGLVLDISNSFALKSGTENIIAMALTDELTWSLSDGSFVWDLISEYGGQRFFIVPTEPMLVETPATQKA